MPSMPGGDDKEEKKEDSPEAKAEKEEQERLKKQQEKEELQVGDFSFLLLVHFLMSGENRFLQQAEGGAEGREGEV